MRGVVGRGVGVRGEGGGREGVLPIVALNFYFFDC